MRIRRDADEQMVLAHVYNRLSNLVSVLTVQIFKDDWKRPHTFQLLGEMSAFSKSGGDPLLTNNALYSSPSGSFYQQSPMSQAQNVSSVNRPISTISSGTTASSINMNKLNPDILSLLGSAAPQGHSDSPAGTTARYTIPSETDSVTRTEPDGASRLN